MTTLTIPLSLAGLALISTPALAQEPDLSRAGGAVPGNATWTVSDQPGEIYAIIVALDETPSEILPGVQFQISGALLNLSFELPGLIGLLDGAGSATAVVPLVDPSLAGLTISAQAVTSPTFGLPSNLTRTTTALPRTFASTVEDPALPVIGVKNIHGA